MFLTVKLLLGRRCSVKVTGQESVATLKKMVSKRLQVPEEQQHLLFRGQLLADDKSLSDYSIGPHASINVIVRPLEKLASAQAHQSLWHHLGSILAQHFEPDDAKAVLQLVRQEHDKHLQKIHPEDLEQLVSYLLAQEEPPPETESHTTTSELPGKEEAEEKQVEEKEVEEKEVEEQEVEEKEVVEEEEEEEEDVQEEEEEEEEEKKEEQEDADE